MIGGNGLLVLGFGGHARSVADVALDAGINLLRFVDGNAQAGETFLGFTVQRHWPAVLPEGWSVIAASGDGRRREDLANEVLARGWPLATIVARTATLGLGARIGPGSFVGHHAHLGPMARVGAGCIVNTAAIIEHESVVGDFSHVSVRSTMAGRSSVGAHCFIGAGATLVDGVHIAAGSVIGAAACVHRSLEQPGVYVGVPARLLRSESS